MNKNDNSNMTKEELEAAREFYFGPADYEQDEYTVIRKKKDTSKSVDMS